MKLLNLTALWIVALHVVSCVNGSNELQKALKSADENRPELEKVLDHYKNNKEKYEIAKFLVSNSQYHYSFVGDNIDSIKNALSTADDYGVIDSIEQHKWENFNNEGILKLYDNKVLKAEFFIKNIEYAYKVWKDKKWNKNLSIEDFCEYILPYRVADEETDNWREVYYNTFNNALDSIYDGDDAYEAASCMLNYLKEKYSYNFTWVLEYPHLGGTYLLNNRVGKCRDACDFITYVFRSVGIPVAEDFYTYSPETRKGHIWNSVKTNYGWLPFSYPYTMPLINNFQIDSRSPSTVYRKSFSIQNCINNNLLPLFNNKFCINVSENYFKNYSLCLKSDADYSYVGVFERTGWTPVAYTNVNMGNANFRYLGPNQIYIQMETNGQNIFTIGDPFLYDGEKIRYFHADTTIKKSQILTRKFPLSERVKNYMHDIKGAEIWVKNNRYTFKRIFKIDSVKDGYNNIHFDIPIEAQQIKFVSSAYGSAQLAEMHFFYNGKEISPLSIIGECPATKGTFEWQINDNNPLSYFISSKKGATIRFEFENKTKIDSISYIPRTDENWIRIGDLYELYYWDASRWKSLGTKIAKNDYLHYDNIPNNSLLYLRNTTRGEEELPFFLENGHQIFVSQAID